MLRDRLRYRWDIVWFFSRCFSVLVFSILVCARVRVLAARDLSKGWFCRVGLKGWIKGSNVSG